MNRVLNILDGAHHCERFLRVSKDDGVHKYPVELLGTKIDEAICEKGIVIEMSAPHMYNLFMTTLYAGEIVMYLHACLDENGMIKGRFEFNAFGMGILASDDQLFIDNILTTIDNEVWEGHWDLVNHTEISHPLAADYNKEDPTSVPCHGNECEFCSIRECPFEEPLHLHHDGCPTCK